MKVIIDLVGVHQHWDADTNENTSYAQLVVGGVEMNVPVSEDQLRALIASTQQPAPQPVPHGPEETYAENPINEETVGLPINEKGERVFGGDIGDQDHSLFQPPEESLRVEDIDYDPPPARVVEKSSTQQRLEAIQASRAKRPITARQDAKAELRARANRRPPGRPPQDEMGYPIVPKKAPVHKAPEVTTREVHSSVEEADEFFSQG